MRIERQCLIDAPREEVWALVSDPKHYPRLMHGITRFDHTNDVERAPGARYRMLMRVGSADVGGVVEIVDYDEPADIAWTSITGIDQRGRWRLRETRDGRTRVTFRLSYGSPGGLMAAVADRISEPMVARNIERSLENLRREFEGREVMSGDGMSLPGRVAYTLGSLRVLAERGVLRPMRPDKLARMVATLARWGRSPAAG
jgi:uncharacterized membrane protein